MSEKGKPDWTRHDFGAFHDMRIAQIRAKFGLEGYGLFWFLVEELGKAPEHRITISNLDYLAFACHMPADKIQSFLVFATSIDLFESDGACFYSPRLNRELDKFYEISQSRARAGKKGGKQKASKSLANTKQIPSQDSTGQDTTEQNKTGQDITQQTANERVYDHGFGVISQHSRNVAALFANIDHVKTKKPDAKDPLFRAFDVLVCSTEHDETDWQAVAQKTAKANDWFRAKGFGLDWIAKPENTAKILRGDYDGETGDKKAKPATVWE